MKIKNFVIIVFLAGLFGSIYFGFTAKGKPTYPDKAFQAFHAKDLSKTKEALLQTSTERLALPLNLYKGYAASLENDFETTEELLRPLLHASCRIPKEELEAQVHLGLIHTAYQLEKDFEIFPHIEEVKKIAPGHPSFLFFHGLSYYLRERYSEAYRLWNAYHPPHVNKEAAWLTALIDHHYSSCWRHIHLAHCLLERGDICGGRQLLEQQQHQMGKCDNQYYDLATLFLGLTYLKEAANFANTERDSHYQLAHFYFKGASKLEAFGREKCCIISHIENELRSRLAYSLDPKEHAWTFEFIRLLQDWEGTKALQAIANQLVSKFVNESDPKRLAFCQQMKKELSLSFHHIVFDKLLEHLKETIIHDGETSFDECWAFMSEIAPNLEGHTRELAAFVRSHLFKRMFWDDDKLSRSHHLIAFYRELVPHPSSDRRLSFDLLHQASEFWQQEGQEARGALLMDLALSIAPQKSEAEEWIGVFLKDLYRGAEENNLLDRLTLVHDCMAHFNVCIEPDLNSHSKLANHLADAEYLYEARNYASAKTHATWVLKLDPENHSAMRIVGLSAYHMGEYGQALDVLMQLPYQDFTVKKAIAFSSVYAGDSLPTEHIAQIDAIDSFKEDE